MAGSRHSKKRTHLNRTELEMTKLIEEHTLFEDYRKDVLPKLQRLLKEGKTAEDLYKLFSDQAAARAITIALTDTDSGKALQAIKEIQDRAHGKPKEQVVQTHKYEKLTDQELDSLLKSKIEEAGLSLDEEDEDDGEEQHQHS